MNTPIPVSYTHLLPIYGDGRQIRDWLFVGDHVQALYLVLTKGRVGESYNIGGNCEKTNLEVVKMICELLEELVSNKPNHIKYYEDLMTFVKDRPGHDVRYSLDCSKIHAELGLSLIHISVMACGQLRKLEMINYSYQK